MPIVKAQGELPAKEILERGEYIRDGRGSGRVHQDIRAACRLRF